MGKDLLVSQLKFASPDVIANMRNPVELGGKRGPRRDDVDFLTQDFMQYTFDRFPSVVDIRIMSQACGIDLSLLPPSIPSFSLHLNTTQDPGCLRKKRPEQTTDWCRCSVISRPMICPYLRTSLIAFLGISVYPSPLLHLLSPFKGVLCVG